MIQPADTHNREAAKAALVPHLFPEEDDLNTFAVLDGASNPDLRDQLHEHKPEHICLYRGALEPDMAEVAPYLVLLKRDHPFTNLLLASGWGAHWGIFARAPVTLPEARRHFRQFLMVRDHEGKDLAFRYYDPRVLRIFLPTCDAEELESIFGPVARFYCEDEMRQAVMFEIEESGLKTKLIPLAGA